MKSPNPAMNVPQRFEPVATDSVYANAPAINNGCTAAQFFVGRKTLVCDVYPLKSDKEFINTLEDVIHKRAAMAKLISDSAQVEISNHMKDLLRALIIYDWQSEPHQQQQNFAERMFRDVKRLVNWLALRTIS
jgi:hypothetical protein